jgi:tRNA(His) guanylyltransferase
MTDSLATRMKERYEDRTRYLLPRRTWTIIRIDGKSFHTYTRKFVRPFDDSFIDTMDRTAVFLCEALQGSNIGFVQSDEISIVLSDLLTTQTEAWFDGNLQKIVSVAASMATMVFNKTAAEEGSPLSPTATFDARAFTIPDRQEVMNYLIWRQQDASRNSIQAAAQSVYGPFQLHGKNNANLHQMLFEKGINWDEYKPRYKRGAAVIKKVGPGGCESPGRTEWVADAETPIFTQDRAYLDTRIPTHGYEEKLLASVASVTPRC